MTDEIDSAGIPRAMSSEPLPPPPPPDADVLAFVTMALDKHIDPEILGRLIAPETVAANGARDAERRANDWPALARYRAANAAIATPPEMVMIGDSITEIWGLAEPGLFDGTVLNRGISGQTSAQILLRFYPDVVALRPRQVHILCGTNDIAGNTGPNVPEDYQRNICAMLDLAGANGIEVLLASVTPAAAIMWSAEARPREWVPQLNEWLRDLAAKRGARFVDYHAVLNDGNDGLRDEYSSDGVHVTRAAYSVMRSLLESVRGGPGAE
jgi:lysophospholipase L1-like esterase